MRYIILALHVLVGHKAVTEGYNSPLRLVHRWLPRSRLAPSCVRTEASPQHLPREAGPAEETPGKLLLLPGTRKEKDNMSTLCDQSHTDIH